MALGDTVRKEPAFILDTTGSMAEPVTPGSMMSKAALAEQITRILVHDLGSEDSQGTDEKDGGGLSTVLFADGIASEVGDLNDANFDQKWRKIKWGGGTYIAPAFELVEENFKEEFGHLPEGARPTLALGIITDGALSDLNAATNWLHNVSGGTYVYVVVVGSGMEHDRAVKQWQNIAEQNTHVRVEAASQSTDPHAIAAGLLQMFQ